MIERRVAPSAAAPSRPNLKVRPYIKQKPGAEVAQAEKLGVKIITAEEFEKILKGKGAT